MSWPGVQHVRSPSADVKKSPATGEAITTQHEGVPAGPWRTLSGGSRKAELAAALHRDHPAGADDARETEEGPAAAVREVLPPMRVVAGSWVPVPF